MADPVKYGATWGGINPLTGQPYKWGDDIYYDAPVAPSPNTNKPMLIHVLLDFIRKSDPELDEFAAGVFTKTTANAVIFTNPPAALAALSPAQVNYHNSIIALGGGKGTTADKEAKKEIVIGYLRQLAAYVQAIPGITLENALKSGFDVIELGHTTSVTLTVPAILGITNLNSGQLGVKLQGVPGATGYEFRLTVAGSTVATSQYFSSTRNIVLIGLTPGATYSIQVRARAGKNQASDWSEAVTHMST